MQTLNEVKKTTLDAYANQDIPFEQVLDQLDIERSLSRTPLFQVLFVLQNNPPGTISLDGLSVVSHDISAKIAKFDLTLFLTETAEGISGSFEYVSALFDKSTIERIIIRFSQ